MEVTLTACPQKIPVRQVANINTVKGQLVTAATFATIANARRRPPLMLLSLINSLNTKQLPVAIETPAALKSRLAARRLARRPLLVAPRRAPHKGRPWRTSYKAKETPRRHLIWPLDSPMPLFAPYTPRHGPRQLSPKPLDRPPPYNSRRI